MGGISEGGTLDAQEKPSAMRVLPPKRLAERPAPTLPKIQGAAMPRSLLSMISWTILLLALSPWSRAAEEKAPTPEQVRFFEAKVRPVLADQCFKCHGPTKQKANLRLDSRAGMLTGGDTGPVVVEGKPEESLLVAAVRHDEDGPKMPPSK